MLAEQVGQNYAHELRNRLLRGALDDARPPALAITIARSTNDLTSVRGWVAQGIAPLVALVPLVVGALTLLALLPLESGPGGRPPPGRSRARLRPHRGPGILAAPLAATGRTVELRQNYRAARRVLAPSLAADSPDRTAGSARVPRQVLAGHGFVTVLGPGIVLGARAGDRIQLTGTPASHLSSLLHDLVSPGPNLQVIIDGWPYAALPPRRRRTLVGLAAADTSLERGTIARAVRYRRPDFDAAVTDEALDRVGLTASVAALSRGSRTELRRGGEPLTGADVARLSLARAALGDPPLLLLDHIHGALDEAGLKALTALVENYPGVVVFTSERPARVCADYRSVFVQA